ncbi:MAG: WYL domain-containing protein [Pseudomonadota bacterium]
MEDKIPKIRGGSSQRLEYIDFLLYWEGTINRKQLSMRFGVSTPQASADIGAYQERAPGNIEYDKSAKRYTATPNFLPIFFRPNADRFLSQLTALTAGIILLKDTWILSPPPTSVIPLPTRRVEPQILRNVLSAVRGNYSIEVKYQSMNATSPEPTWRRITPHAFGSDGFRWHTRAYCHRTERFKDFLLSRCFDVRGQAVPGPSASQDELWNSFFTVRLEPNPRLSEAQRRAIEADYDMREGSVNLTVRRALLYYFDKRLRLDITPNPELPKETPIVVANSELYEASLREVNARRPISNAG